MLEVLRRPDVRIYYAVEIEGLSEAWAEQGCPVNLFGYAALRRIIAQESVVLTYARLEPMRGIGTPGSLSLRLQDIGGYIPSLFALGATTYLTAAVADDDSTIHVGSTEGFSTGRIVIQGTTYAYTGKTADTFTGCALADATSAYRPAHSVDRLSGPQQAALPAARVRVSESQGSLTSRYIIVRAAALDPGGYPIADDSGATFWEVWRGMITDLPRSPDASGYQLRAETLERMIPDRAPTSGPHGVIDARNGFKAGLVIDQDSDWYGYLDHTEYFFPEARSLVCFGAQYVALGADPEQTITAWVHEMGTYYGWAKKARIERAIFTLFEDRLGGAWTADLIFRPDDQIFELRVSTLSFASASGPYCLAIVPRIDTIWNQLGFLGQQNCVRACVINQPVTFVWTADIAPASVALAADDTEIPIVMTGLTRNGASGGWAKIGDEIVRYAGILWHTGASPDVGSDIRAILHGCQRGYGGTQASPLIFRAFDGDDPPEVSPAWAMQDERSVWPIMAKALCGTSGAAENLFVTGPNPDDPKWGEYTEPGHGISALHFDGAALYSLMGADALLSPLTGAPEDFRSWLSDCLALEGYGLACVPGDDGKCLLRPIRISGANPAEVVANGRVDPTDGLAVTSGLSALKNAVEFRDQKDGRATFNDLDSQQTHRVLQTIEFEAPVANAAVFPALGPTAIRIFEIMGERYAYLESGMAPVGVRFLSPGEVVDLAFVESAYNGIYRVLGASTPLRGAGKVRLSGLRVEHWQTRMYAPTTLVISVAESGFSFAVTVGGGSRYRENARLWVHDPGNWTVGVLIDIDLIDGDTIYCNDTTGISEGYEVEFDGEDTSADEDRYLWLDTGLDWGD
jgi:hypothetical protein